MYRRRKIGVSEMPSKGVPGMIGKGLNTPDEKLAERTVEAVRYNIRHYLILRNATQSDLAAALHVTKGAISQILSGSICLKLRHACLIAQALGISLSDLTDPQYLLKDQEDTDRMLGKRQER